MASEGTFRGVRRIIASVDCAWGSPQQCARFHIVRDEATWLMFCEEFNAGFVRSIAKHCRYEMPCQSCGRLFHPGEIVHTGYKGNGGIGIQFCDNVCTECADEQHDEYVATVIWSHMSYAERKSSIEIANIQNGTEIPISAARRKKPPIPGPDIIDPEYY